jgi:uncharacterized protein
LFVYDTPQMVSFWMKDTLIPLEMIFIDEDKTIVDILAAPPCEADPCLTYAPRQKVAYVLEVKAGFSQKNNIQIHSGFRFDTN